MATDSAAAITELLSKWNTDQLFQLSKFHRARLEEAIEEEVEGVSFLLTYKGHISGQDHQEIVKLRERGNRVDGSKLLVSLVVQKEPHVHRLIWKAFLKLHHVLPKLDALLKEMQELASNPTEALKYMEYLSDQAAQLKDVQQKHKAALRTQAETLRVNTILMKEKVKVFQLVDRYAELTVISTVRDRRLVEHELRARGRDHEEWREKLLRGDLEKIRNDQLFKNCFTQSNSKSGSSSAVAGVPGIGKTTMVQKIVHDWATGKIYQHFQFVFSFKFQDLNRIKDRTNLSELILHQYPYFGNILGEVWKNPEGLLFIFDGLDEFKHRIDFADSRRDTEPQHMCLDPEWRCEVSDIVYSLIQHKLLPGCSVLVTTRPTALHLLEKAEISVWAEILGFVGKERKEYFNRYFEDQTVAAAVFKHMEENEILYTMSYNPSYCWILGLALGPFFSQRHRDLQRVPKTITQLYSYYIYNILKNHGREIESPGEVLLRVGQMAFRGVSEKKIVFTDRDLIKYNLQPSQFLSGFLMELLEREDCARSVVYTFPHLTIQEFVAALAQFLTPEPGDILKLLTEAHSTPDGRFEVFIRFVAGLSFPGSARGLEEFLGPFPHQTTCRVIDWVKKEVKRQSGNTESESGKRSLLNTVHYLFECQNHALAQAALGSLETLSLSGLRLTPTDCAVLSHVIGLCDTISHLDLDNCHIQRDGLQRLGAGLHKVHKLGLKNNGLTECCAEELASVLSTNRSLTVLNLSENKLRDSGVKLVSEALRDSDCKIQKLWLWSVGLTSSGAEFLAPTLRAMRWLTVLDLSGNKLGDSGMRQLSEALRESECELQDLQMKNNGLTECGAGDIASLLSTNRTLTLLNLSENDLRDSGVKLVSAALKDSECKIQELFLWDVGLTYSSAEVLTSALRTMRSLTVLDLSDNKLGDSGAKMLSEALRNSECDLKELRLRDNSFTEPSAEHLASALSVAKSLTVLNLSQNRLGDWGLKRVAEALMNSKCKIQKLWLWSVGMTASGAEFLALALRTMRSLTVLDLVGNKLGNAGAKVVFEALRSSECALEDLRLKNSGLTEYCAEALASVLSTNRSLTILNLSENDLKDSGVKLVSAALRDPDCKIQELFLWSVGLTAPGAEFLAPALSKMRSLTMLDLSDNKLGDLGVKLVSEALRNSKCELKELRLRDNSLTEACAEHLASAVSVTKSLKVLNLSKNHLGDWGLKRVAEALVSSECKIKALWLWSIGLTASGATFLAPALRSMRSLTVLDLVENKLGDSGLKLLSEALMNSGCELRDLRLKNSGLTDSCAEDLASLLSTNRSLKVLNLSENDLRDSGVKLVSAALNNTDCRIQELFLWSVGLTAPGAEFLAPALSKMRSLTMLDLSDNKLGDSGAKLLSEALRDSKCELKELRLRDNSLKGPSAEHLASVLSVTKSLKVLNLSKNNLGDSGVRQVAAALRNSECQVTDLWLWSVGLTASGAQFLAPALRSMPSLTVLDLVDNNLGDSGAKVVFAALRKSEIGLKDLRLRRVGLTDSGAEDLVSALSTNRSLTNLGLGSNSLTDGSVPALRRLILTLPSLEQIWLWGNRFSSDGEDQLRSLQRTKPGLRLEL